MKTVESNLTFIGTCLPYNGIVPKVETDTGFFYLRMSDIEFEPGEKVFKTEEGEYVRCRCPECESKALPVDEGYMCVVCNLRVDLGDRE